MRFTFSSIFGKKNKVNRDSFSFKRHFIIGWPPDYAS
jgi:hypothetical protein